MHIMLSRMRAEAKGDGVMSEISMREFFDHVEEHPPEFNTYALALEIEQCHGVIHGATKPKRTPLTQRLGAWAMRCFDAWLQGGKRWDWGDGK